MKKKNENIDINNKIVPLKFMGLMAALALTLVSFEWKSYHAEEVIVYEDPFDFIEVELVPPVPPEPKPENKVIVQKERKLVFETVIDSIIIDTAFVTVVEPIVEPVVGPPEVVARIVKPTAPIEFPDEMAEFPGGTTALYKYLSEETEYPEIALMNNITGKVFVKFVVTKSGDIGNIEILKDIGGGCGEAVMKVVKKSPKWKPGVKDGYKVDSYFTLPFNFQQARN